MTAKSLRLSGSLAAVVALLLGIGSAAAVAGNASSKPKCTYSLTNSPGAGKGTESGTVTCPAPAGKGKAKTSYTYKMASSGTINAKGTFKDTFKHGTFSGTYTEKSSDAGAKFTGHFKITGATGKLSSAHGSGTQTCTSSDGDMHFSCTAILTKGKL